VRRAPLSQAGRPHPATALPRFAAAAIAAAGALAQAHPTLASEDLAACMFRQSGEEQEEALRGFLVAVLSEAERDAVGAALARYGAAVAEVAMRGCGVTLEEIDGPRFAEAVEHYGALLGMRVMENALRTMRGGD
jgi:hypothetical protein